MKIDGKFTLNAPRCKVWETLNDVEALGSMIPGAKGLEEIGLDEYQATMNISIGPIKTSFNGKVRIAERNEPVRYVLQVEGKSRHGWMSGTGTVNLDELSEDSTLVDAVGDVQVGGMIARVGQRMISGLAKQMMQTFFKNVESAANRL